MIEEPLKEVNEDALIGFVMRKAYECGVNLSYAETKAVLDAELEFLTNEGLADIAEG
ncbi:hypothetical protein [Oceanobacillus kimchii]|uniref:hypothetical protein n=1 Tax=Oceanobacillus kimchii TaxID=746691 RepID=UPI003B01992F